MKKYEAVFILDIRRADDEGASFSAEFAELIASFGGVMGETVPMGRTMGLPSPVSKTS